MNMKMDYQKIQDQENILKNKFPLIEGRGIETRDSGLDGNLGGGR